MSTLRFFIYSSPSPTPSAPATNMIPATPPPRPEPKALLGDFNAVSSSPFSPTTPTTPAPIPSPNPTPPRLRRLMKLAFKVGNQQLRRRRKLENTLDLKRKQQSHSLLSMSPKTKRRRNRAAH